MNEPHRSTIDVDGVPRELIDRPQWTAWRREQRHGKWTKPPISPRTGTYASTRDPATWGTFAEAMRRCEDQRLSGVGFIVTAEDPIAGVDLDDCLDPATPALEPWARKIVDELASYTEVTPSGKGIRILVQGTLPAGGRKLGNVEMYDQARFFTVTGHRLPGSPTTIEARQEALAALHLRVFGSPTAPVANGASPARPAPSAPTPADDAALVERATRAKNGERFRQLWRGEWSGYPSQSEADLALCSMLVFWTDGDADCVDRLFRQSGLYREKWDARHFGDGTTYGQATIAKARAAVRDPFFGNDADVAMAALGSPGPLAPDALCGLAGELTNVMALQSEADPVAILAQVLVIFGNVVGRGPHAMVENDRHGLNEFIVTVGNTGHGRKGVAYGRAQYPFRTVDPVWNDACVQGGLSTGEGLIAAVRDPIERQDPIKVKGHVTGYTTVIADHGVPDKRLLVVETEFAKMLRVMDRDGNTLSETVRQAWDSAGRLRVMTRQNPLRATDAHISIVGHVTREDLLKFLTSTDAANGFANRFLWLCTRRAQVLPDGGALSDAELVPFVERLRKATSFARTVGRMSRDEGAREIWHNVYASLSEARPGLLGAVTSRAEAHVLRLSLIYALLDLSAVVQPVHLRAALALWRYAEASARFLFGTTLGDPMADSILRDLRNAPDGLTQTEIHDLFKRSRKVEEIDRALGVLLELDLVGVEQVETGGRPAKRWWARLVT
jgi:hypothetical protein